MRIRTWIVSGILCAIAASALGQTATPTTQVVQSAMDRAAAELNQAHKSYDIAVDTLQATQSELRSAIGRLDVSPETLQKAAARLDEQLESLQLEEVGSTARRRATEMAIKEEAARAEDRMKQDPVAAELQKVVAAREYQLKEAQSGHQAGMVSQADVRVAEVGLAEAKAKVAERQHAVFTGGDSETLATLRRDLLNLAIGDQERAARIGFLRQQRSQLSGGIKDLPELQRRQEAVESSRRLLDRAEERVQMIRIYGVSDREEPRTAKP